MKTQAYLFKVALSNTVDQNGEVDLLVTNFYDESNTLYLQKAGLFSDATLST